MTLVADRLFAKGFAVLHGDGKPKQAGGKIPGARTTLDYWDRVDMDLEAHVADLKKNGKWPAHLDKPVEIGAPKIVPSVQYGDWLRILLRIARGFCSFPGQSVAGPGELRVNSRAAPPVRAWRVSFDDALEPVEQPCSDNGPYVIHHGEPAATCVHEAGHAVANVCAGRRLDRIDVELRFCDYLEVSLPPARAANVCPLGQRGMRPRFAQRTFH